MFYKTDICKAAWEEEKRNSAIGDTYSNIESWGEFWNYVSSSYSEPSEREYVSAIVDMLRAEGVLTKNGSVLDISCGPGTYSLPFLNAGAKHIDCVDSSNGMIAELKKSLNKAQLLDRVGIFHCTWDEFMSSEKYDLVFCSMSPAVSEYDELMRMEEFSHGNCCLITYGNGGTRYLIRDRLWEELRGPQTRSDLFDVIYPFNILYSIGRHPNMRTFQSTSLSRMPLDKAFEYYKEYFKIFGYTSESDQTKIRACLESVAQEGFCCEDVCFYNSVIWWEIP